MRVNEIVQKITKQLLECHEHINTIDPLREDEITQYPIFLRYIGLLTGITVGSIFGLEWAYVSTSCLGYFHINKTY